MIERWASEDVETREWTAYEDWLENQSDDWLRDEAWTVFDDLIQWGHLWRFVRLVEAFVHQPHPDTHHILGAYTPRRWWEWYRDFEDGKIDGAALVRFVVDVPGHVVHRMTAEQRRAVIGVDTLMDHFAEWFYENRVMA